MHLAGLTSFEDKSREHGPYKIMREASSYLRLPRHLSQPSMSHGKHMAASICPPVPENPKMKQHLESRETRAKTSLACSPRTYPPSAPNAFPGVRPNARASDPKNNCVPATTTLLLESPRGAPILWYCLGFICKRNALNPYLSYSHIDTCTPPNQHPRKPSTAPKKGGRNPSGHPTPGQQRMTAEITTVVRAQMSSVS